MVRDKSQKLISTNYYKSGLRDRSTRCAFLCAHSICDSNGASLGHLSKSGKMFSWSS